MFHLNWLKKKSVCFVLQCSIAVHICSYTFTHAQVFKYSCINSQSTLYLGPVSVFNSLFCCCCCFILEFHILPYVLDISLSLSQSHALSVFSLMCNICILWFLVSIIHFCYQLCVFCACFAFFEPILLLCLVHFFQCMRRHI